MQAFCIFLSLINICNKILKKLKEFKKIAVIQTKKGVRMGTELFAKIASYIKANNLSPTMDRKTVLSQMVAEGVITQNEYDAVINGNIYSLSKNGDSQSVGDNLTIITSPDNVSPAKSTQSKPHPVFPNLLVKNDGSVDLSQFDTEAIKAQYPSDVYNIDIGEADEITSILISYKDGRAIKELVISPGVSESKNEYAVCDVDKDGQSTNVVRVDDSGIILSSTVVNVDNSTVTRFYNNGSLSDINRIVNSYPNNDSMCTFFENGKITEKIMFNDKDDTYIRTAYQDGKPYADFDKYGYTLFVYNIDEFSDAVKNLYNMPYISSAQCSPIIEKSLIDKMSKLSPENINSTLQALLVSEDIDLFMGIEYTPMLIQDAKKNIMTKLDEIGIDQQSDVEEQARYIANRLSHSFSYDNFDDIDYLLGKITNDNVLFVLKDLGTYDNDNDNERSKVSKSSGYTVFDMINNSNLPDEQKSQYINGIVDKFIEYTKSINLFCDDIVSDINDTREDFSKLDFNCKRLLARMGNRSDSTVDYEINGRLDKPFNQVGTGDCWLVEGMNTILYKPGGADILNELLTLDKGKKVLKVSLPYTDMPDVSISFDRITKSNHLLSGDPDPRAFEIAYDEYIKDMGYREIIKDQENQTSGTGHPKRHKNMTIDTDINGGFSVDFYRAVLGNGISINNPPMDSIDFNDDNQVFVFAYFNKNEPLWGYAFDMGGNIEDAEIIPLDTSHAYGVFGNDEKYVHFHDPRMQGKIIYVEKDSFNEDNHSSLESAYLKRNAKKP